MHEKSIDGVFKELELKPENTTECIAPILAHASIEIINSGIIARYI